MYNECTGFKVVEIIARIIDNTKNKQEVVTYKDNLLHLTVLKSKRGRKQYVLNASSRSPCDMRPRILHISVVTPANRNF